MHKAFCLLPKTLACPAVGKEEGGQTGFLPGLSLSLPSRNSGIPRNDYPVALIGESANPFFIGSLGGETLREMDKFVLLYLGKDTEGFDEFYGDAVVKEKSHAANLVSN